MATALQQTDDQDHFNDWPNEPGFDANYEERTPVELDVAGHIPAYAAGILYRTGPGRYSVDTEQGETFKLSHWFDGFSQTHRFQIIVSDDSPTSTRVFYNSRFSTDHLIEEVRRTGQLASISFGQKRDPCKTVFQKVQSSYDPTDPSMHNIGVTLSINMPVIDGPYSGGEINEVNGGRWTSASGIKTLYGKTDTSNYKKIDPETLEPIGLATQANLHPQLDGPLSASHARSDPVTGSMYNFNLTFSPAPIYRIFCASASTGETKILATFPGIPAYLHSLLLTEDYVLLCVWNSHVSPANFQGSFLEAIQPYDPSKPATWYVVDRKGDRGLVATYESSPFFCFHTINAWQEPSPSDQTKTDIVADLVTYGNIDILHQTLYENMISNSPQAKALVLAKQDISHATFSRFRLPSVPSTPSTDTQTAIVEWKEGRGLSPELPTMNPNLVTRKHRYTYAVVNRGESTFFDGIVKFDSETRKVLLWAHHAQSPGEPIFVADPNGSKEDDGVLLSVVLNGRTGKSFLLCLDAHNLTELGRANVGGPVAFGFHGQHIPTRGVPTGDY
ncbi:hypothetical protein EYZ11_000770 [Aspergillus tanneri]|uniref:Dioxygenase n=1 Tax=Aspergillus tanneri TaxID=1220188 RepID=A0A4V3UQN7_9EURO|nr:uncharacterized protein ATNIH1004_004903 [Aspergillus tanneri]KAA8649013.1 hypothetical protein ATNIH1004_004903 [Aspergillus tanneri]THC99720.1 hypothetical protein EYZ11_000770 [Aspergillus tanneri]